MPRISTDFILISVNANRIAYEKYPNIKIVIITGYDEFEYARESVKLGISDYIRKPIRAQELLKTIEKLKKIIAKERMILAKAGETFVSCLTNIRIRRASELLRHTDLKSYLIGLQVGITDPHYFSILLKKNTGMSVSEFRKFK